MPLEKALSEIGLPEREIKVYLATLELGESTVSPIADKSGMKRTYCYDILESLRDKGLVSYVERNNRRRYIAEDPEKIRSMLASRLEQFITILPELKSIHNQAAGKPKVRFYDGLEGIEAIYEQLVKTDAYAAIASGVDIEYYFHDYLEMLAKKVLERDILARELLVRTPKTINFIAGYTTERQQVRWLPEGVKLKTDMLLFDNQLVLISYGEDIHAVVVEGSHIVDSHMQLFELLWASASTNSQL